MVLKRMGVFYLVLRVYSFPCIITRGLIETPIQIMGKMHTFVSQQITDMIDT